MTVVRRPIASSATDTGSFPSRIGYERKIRMNPTNGVHFDWPIAIGVVQACARDAEKDIFADKLTARKHTFEQTNSLERKFHVPELVAQRSYLGNTSLLRPKRPGDIDCAIQKI